MFETFPGIFFRTGVFLLSNLQRFEINGDGVLETNFLFSNTPPNEMLNWARAAECQENSHRAIDLYKTLWDMHEKILGSEHPDSQFALNLLYQAYFTSEKYNEALPLAWKIYKFREKTLGKEHEDTVTALSCLGNLYLIKGKWEKAEGFLKRAYRLRKAQQGQNHQDTVDILCLLAQAYRDSREPKNLELALRYYNKVYHVRSTDSDLGEEHEKTLESLVNIGNVLALQTKRTEAVEIFEKVLEIQTRRLGEDHPSTQEVKHVLFHTLTAAGKTGRAKKILGKRDQEIDQDVDSLYTLVEGKIAALADQQKYETALEILTEVYKQEILKPRVSVKLLSVLGKLVTFSEKLNDTDQIVKWANIIVDLYKSQKVKVKVEVTTDQESENMATLCLDAIMAAIDVYIQRNEEQNVDEWFNIARSTKVNKGQEQLADVVGKFSLIVKNVADFKRKIGDTNKAVMMYAFLAQNSQDDQISLSGLYSLASTAIDKDDAGMMKEIALRYLYKEKSTLEPEFKQESESESESDEKLQLRELTSQYLFRKAKELFERRNFEWASSLLKTVEKIWPKTWPKDDFRTHMLLQIIGMSALKLRNFDEGLFYLDKLIHVLKAQLNRESNMDEKNLLTKGIQRFETVHAKFKNMSNVADFDVDAEFDHFYTNATHSQPDSKEGQRDPSEL